MNSNLDEIRINTLNKIEQNERHYKYAFVGIALIELVFLAAFILLADFSNRLHVLLLLTTMVIYTIVGFGLIALGLHINRNTLRILQAIENIR